MNLYPEARKYLEAGLRIIPLYPMHGGKCTCENPNCTAGGKHPLRSNWTSQRIIDTATLYDVWQDVYKCNGLGFALDSDHLIIDVDPRNGGEASLKQLQADLGIDLFDHCSAIAKTGGGGYHFYYRRDDSKNLGWKMPEKYRGIDIKMGGGFVVTVGSIHSSGNFYEWYSPLKSDLIELEMVPDCITALLEKAHSEHRSAMQAAGLGDIAEITEMLSYISPDCDYESWVKIGMATHDATAGSPEGLALWDKWSRDGGAYKEGECAYKWHTFGKRTSNISTMGTLVYIARQAGWEPAADSTALTPEQLQEIKDKWDQKKTDRVVVPSIAEDEDIDLHSPPGLLGRINDYVYDCCAFPNRNLALACALSVLTNTIGRKYYLPGKYSSVQPNLLVLCIAGSSVGKDSILGAAQNLLSVTGLDTATHGRIKSDKDLIDALERNQYAMYYVDEFGYVLKRIENAMKKGGATYLEGIIASIMEVFTKGDKCAGLDLSRKLEIKERYTDNFNKLSKALEDGNFKDRAMLEAKIAKAKVMMTRFDRGLPNPFLSMFTTATPRTMELAFSGEATENGFLSRALTFHEYDTNPRPKPEFKGVPKIPTGLEMALRAIAFDKDNCPFGRIDSFEQERIELPIDHDAQVFIERAIDYFFDLAETQKEAGLESLPRRAFDSIIKICIALAAENGRLTLDLARYAVKLVRHEISAKIRRVSSTEGMASRDKVEKMDGVASRICEVCNTRNGETFGAIFRACKSSRVTKEVVEQMIDSLVENGFICKIDTGRTYAELPVYRYKTTSKGSEV